MKIGWHTIPLLWFSALFGLMLWTLVDVCYLRDLWAAADSPGMYFVAFCLTTVVLVLLLLLCALTPACFLGALFWTKKRRPTDTAPNQ